MGQWAIALHGGAGVISRDMPDHVKLNVELALRDCLELGVSALKQQPSASALDVVELVVRSLEDNPIFNAGKGSVLTTKGTVEMEASIMDGSTMRCGAVSGLRSVVNPISLARLVMEKTPHVYLAFDGAEAFAKQQGVQLADPEYFITDTRLEQLRSAQFTKTAPAPFLKFPNGTISPAVGGDEVKHADLDFVGETVGCVVVDKLGCCAAATSTGGRTNKMVGRIGDSPIVGAGNYANHMCAISGTGIGEAIIRSTVAREVAAIMEYKSASLSDAVKDIIERRTPKDTTGLVAVSSTGEIAMGLNTAGMYRAAANESGYSFVGIWD